jgi:hypothetical protein
MPFQQSAFLRFRDRTEEGIKRVIPETKPGAKESHRRKSATAMPHTFMAPESSPAWSALASKSASLLYLTPSRANGQRSGSAR